LLDSLLQEIHRLNIISDSKMSSVPVSPSTLACILCGGAQLYPGHRYRNHLVHEHGVIFGADFLIQSSLLKLKEMKLPIITTPSEKLFKSSAEVFCQTSDVLCSKCSDPPTNKDKELKKISSCPAADSNSGTPSLVDCWLCPLCPMVYKRRYHFDHHIESAHQLRPDEVSSAWKVSLTEDEFNEKQHQAIVSKVKKEPKFEVGEEFGHELDGKGDKLSWGPRAFSNMFQCKFCHEQFTRDSNLIVHIRLVHKDEPQDSVEQALEQVSQTKLDGCVYQCNICGNKFNTSSSFMRHVNQMHALSLKQYNQEHGSAEIVSGVFFCKLCNKNLKHTRNIITAHMKMVHQISWQEYQNRVQESPDKDHNSSNDPLEAVAPLVLFECALCDSKVKLKRQHLDKAHCMDEDVYAAFLEQGFSGDEKNLVAGSVCCKMCGKLCMDLSKHLQVSHKMMTIMQYDLIPQSEEKKDQCEDNPTNYKCYLNCDNMFKREIDLQVHLKLKHSDVSQEDLSQAKAAALQLEHAPSTSICCEICDSTLSGRSSFWNHLKKRHQLSILQYEDKFGKLPTAAAPFVCKVCSKSLKYERSGIEGHLKNMHSMTWSVYLSWIQEGGSGIVSTLPSPVKLVTCNLCSVSVKSLKNHLKNTHCMTMQDYEMINNIDEIKKETHHASPKQEESLSQTSTVSTRIDIRDKTLKTCNKCQYNFPTRRLFIEHCQVVHGMKFKLKSGESLPPPPIKRKSTSGSPDTKRIKLDFL